MEFAIVEWTAEGTGFSVDPRPYVAELPSLREHMPAGAWDFASDEDHYEFGGVRCIKDLELAGISVSTDKNDTLTIDFAPNKWKHDSGLHIEYHGVSHFSINRGQPSGLPVDTVLLDEILPAVAGCRHEIVCIERTILVECADLVATWGDA